MTNHSKSSCHHSSVYCRRLVDQDTDGSLLNDCLAAAEGLVWRGRDIDTTLALGNIFDHAAHVTSRFLLQQQQQLVSSRSSSSNCVRFSSAFCNQQLLVTVVGGRCDRPRVDLNRVAMIGCVLSHSFRCHRYDDDDNRVIGRRMLMMKKAAATETSC